MATTLSSARRALKALGQRGQTTRIPDAVRVIVLAYAQPADLRKGFDGLYGIVTSELSRDPLDGNCFLFVNRARSRARVLLWDGTGLCIYMKRLERGRFACLWDRAHRHHAVELTMSELSLFLEGSELVGRIPLSPTEIKPTALYEHHEKCGLATIPFI